MPTKKTIIALSAPVTITAAATEGEAKGPAKFSTLFYTGGALELRGWEMPVVVDLATLNNGNVLVANQYHDEQKPVGNFDVANDGRQLVANGTATAATAAAKEVIESGLNGYKWQASLEVHSPKTEEVKAGKEVQVNGQSFTGPLYVARAGTLKGFAFVSHGADDNTTVRIAAIAATKKEKTMDATVTAWAEEMGIDVENASPEQLATIEANYKGQHAAKPVKAAPKNSFETRKIEAKRRKDIRDIADRYIDTRDSDEEEIIAVEKMHDEAIADKLTAQEFKLLLIESGIPQGRTVISPPRNRGLTDRVLEAAICKAGNLSSTTLEKAFSDQELQTAHDYFKDGIGLNQIFILAAESHGYHGTSGGKVNSEVLRAAFSPANRIYAGGFSTLTIADVIAATANKFLHEGWMSVDQTALALSVTRSVRNFQTITTVSLTGALMFEKLGAAGQIKHGTLSDITYTNKADTYAQMLAITRQDQINDDLGALTAVPRRLGRGGMLMLNDIWWTKFLGLVSANFFASGNSNINTGVADMTVGGLDATETIFMNQTDPDGKPLGVTAQILLVPTALKNKAIALMTSEFVGAATTTLAAAPGTGNPFRGRFTVHSSPYVSNSSYTGYTSTGYWMLANPGEVAVMEIAALNGRIEPIVDTAEADFNTLGIQMRGYSDVGVNSQEYRGGVYADGTT